MNAYAHNPLDMRFQGPCSKCDNKTTHQVHAIVEAYEYNLGSGDPFNTKYQIIQCLGCETISFCHETRLEDDPDKCIRRYFPGRREGRREIRGAHLSLPFDVFQMYR